MLLALVSPVLAGLLVNEVVYDPSGSDGGFEWVELCNAGGASVDLTGYEIQVTASAAWTEAYTFASGSIAPGERLLVGYGSSAYTATFSPNLPNAGSATSGVRVVDGADTVLDTVLYGTPNDDGFAEDGGAVPSAGASGATSGKSLGRWPDCADTNSSAADFVVYATADVTPGAENAAPDSGGGDDTGTDPGTTADCAGADGVKINELRYATGEEFVELYNAGGTAVNLEAWELAFGTRPDSTTELALPAVTLEPGMFWVVGSSGASYKDYEHDLADMGNASSTDGVLLNCDGARVDTVLYAEDNADGWTDDSGALATSFAAKPGSSESIARVADGVDTDVCGVDFAADIPSPGLSNTAPPVGDADCTNADGIKINEMVYTTGAEWIELYNAGDGPVALDAWEIAFGTSSYSKQHTVADGVTLAPGDYYVIGTVSGADDATALDFGNASDTDAVRITCNGTPIDTLLYGDPNENAWTDDSGEVATSLAPEHDDGESLARSSDGYDTDQCGLDFVVSTSPTPGAENPYVPPPVCESGTGATVKINEFIYNPDGTDTGAEWVELVNTGDAPIRLDNWKIQVAGSDYADKFTFPTGAELAPGDYLLVGGDQVDGADFVASKLSIDNASSGAAGIRVVDCNGAVIDSVLYGSDHLEDDITGDGGSVEIVPETGDGASLGRYPNGVDTDAAADWHPYSTPTPGAANTDPGATTGGGDDDKKGCGKASGPPQPGGGCTTVLPFGGMEVALATVALLRRRRG